MCAEAFPVVEQAKADVFAGIDRKVGAKGLVREGFVVLGAANGSSSVWRRA
jgi:hypothetical protein